MALSANMYGRPFGLWGNLPLQSARPLQTPYFAGERLTQSRSPVFFARNARLQRRMSLSPMLLAFALALESFSFCFTARGTVWAGGWLASNSKSSSFISCPLSSHNMNALRFVRCSMTLRSSATVRGCVVEKVRLSSVGHPSTYTCRSRSRLLRITVNTGCCSCGLDS